MVGRWDDSPWGPFTDVMVAAADGTRVLLAPSEQVASYVGATYTFDRVELGPVQATGEGRWAVRGPGLVLDLEVGGRLPLGRLLRLVPRRVATAPAWSALTDPIARTMLRGVRTRGSAGQGRQEFYGATDLHRVVAAGGSWRETDLGALAPVWPEPGFGFGSTPSRPSVTRLVTTIHRPG
ncbi:hypothetical protein GCM10011519_06800 [Marmoricola endophyticus]|uniref:Uncharacterized protein n=1 Tax=Marmoricola endophyticus TaxID=2040280 RepID=A0A917BDY3_9ACTN|nr:hypothetical protein [Marmoricola endophyticus]GGF35912.1 hypothetical protein GCM10011519_06800 [Marmoricola endophyticus]